MRGQQWSECDRENASRARARREFDRLRGDSLGAEREMEVRWL